MEGKRCRVGLISIGRKFGHTVGVERFEYLDAEIDVKGRTVRKLDLGEARAAIERMRGKVDVLTVAGYMSVRNPSHERTVRSMAERMLGIPVVCAHELTSKLGFEPRTNTAIINAGLIPTIIDLMDAVDRALKDIGIDAPLMMVKGDGSIMNVNTAKRRPIETIMSGPASSLTSAMVHTGIRDALIADIGGTTTDLGIIGGGFVRTLDSGAVVGGHRTRVRAADISTYGIGGDSRISVENGELKLNAIRVIPVCVASSMRPGIRVWLDSLKSLDSSPSDDVPDCEFYTLASNDKHSYLTEDDVQFLKALAGGPLSVRQVSEMTGVPYERFDLTSMETEGYVTRIGVTPTDILAAEGTYDGYDTGASKKAVALLAGKAGMDIPQFITAVKKAVTEKIARCIMDHMIRSETGKDSLSKAEREMIEQSVRNGRGIGLDLPIVGIGAPVGAWLPEVARFFGTELILPENYDVGNAIGAISSSVTEVVEIHVRAAFQDFSEKPECTVYNGEEAFEFSDMDEAMDFALEEGTRIATARALDSGALKVDVDHRIEEVRVDMGGRKKVFRGATVTVRASGKPMMHWFD